jgi:hypothetical protein
VSVGAGGCRYRVSCAVIAEFLNGVDALDGGAVHVDLEHL